MKTILKLTLVTLIFISCKTDKKQTESIADEVVENVEIITEPKLLVELEGLKHPESVVFDSKRNVLYISNIGDSEDGDGSIAQVSLDGELINNDFVTGLNDPKGQLVMGDKFYVSDNLVLVEIDLIEGKITNRYTHPDIEFLNDVTADADGNVYVSDMFASSIYKLDTEGNMTKWMDTTDLEYPNGLLVVGDKILIAGWGLYSEEGTKGRFSIVDMNDKTITNITAETLGSLDGIQEDGTGNGYYVSDWRGGHLYHISNDGEIEKLLSPGQSLGDIYYNPTTGLMVLPMNRQNKLLFYQMK